MLRLLIPAAVLAASAVPLTVAAWVPPDATSDSVAGGAERIVVLGEEYLLGDLLAPGVEPVAATATVPEAGFHARAIGGRDTAEMDQNGRVWISAEQLPLLAGPSLLLLQSELVEDDSLAVEQVEASPLWPLLPAVQADQVHVMDRLGYPGIEGHIRVIDDLIAALAPA